MARPKKKVRTAPPEEKVVDSESESELHEDYRTSWLLASEDMFVKITAKGKAFRVHKTVVCRHSEYFRACLSKPFKEADDGAVAFDDIEPRYLAFYLGVAYTYSSIIPHACPPPPPQPSRYYPAAPSAAAAAAAAAAPGATLRDFIEVHKLSDRFLSPSIGDFMLQCINASIGEGHRALYHSSWLGPGETNDDKDKGKDKGKGGPVARERERERARQRRLMREFADGYEALEEAHGMQAMLAGRIIEYFCEGVDPRMWDAGMDELIDRPRFVAMVSKGFARKLAEVSTRRARLKRKQLAPP